MTARTTDEFPEADTEVRPFLDDLGIPGIVDVHVHAMPELLQAAVWRYFDGLEDPPWPIAYRGSLDDRLRKLREIGVVGHTALAYPHRPGMLRWLNDFTLDLAETEAQVVPTFTIYPEEGVHDEVVRCLDERDGRAVKVHLQVGRFHATDPRLRSVWREIEIAGIPTVLHASAVYGVDGGGEYCGADEVAALLDQNPHLRLVIAHLGAPGIEEFLDLAQDAPRVYLDTAMVLTEPPYAGMRVDPRLLGRLHDLREQLVFGSDFPTIPHAYAAQIRGLAALELEDDDLRALLHHRGHDLLGILPEID